VSTEIRPRREMETNVDRLRVLSREAEGGDKAARAELRRVVAKCSPAVIAEASNVARRAERMLMKTISAGEPLMQETLEHGDSAYLKPSLPHGYRGAGGQLLVLRIGGRVSGDGQMELSRILAHGRENLGRVVGDSKQWYDPKGRQNIAS